MSDEADTNNTGNGFFDARYGVDASVMARLLGEALGRGGDHAELYFEQTLSRSISFEEQTVKGGTGGVARGLGVRVVAGESIGYAYTEEFDLQHMLRAARAAANIAAGPPRAGTAGSVAISPRAIPDYYGADRHSVDDPAAVKVALIRRADAAARAYAPTVTHVIAFLNESIKRITVATSEGVLVHDTQPQVSLGLTVISERGADRQSAYSGRSGRTNLSLFDEVTPEAIAEEAARIAVQSHEAREAPAGTLPVVLGPGESGVLIHEAVGHGLEADFSRKRTSAYTDRVGQQVASALVTLVDDATLPRGVGTINVDDEGTPGQRTPLIERGVLGGYMHDWISARHFGVPPTGNGRRHNFRIYPQPRMRNTLLLAGDSHPDEIVRSVDFGVYCARFDGGSVNISNGDFVFNTTEAYLIEGGRITAPLKRTNLTGNGPDLLTRVRMVGSDMALTRGTWVCGKNGQSVPAGHGNPTFLVADVTVGGTGR